MDKNTEEVQRLCRLCLVKEDVEIQIFNERTVLSEVFLKITSCVPITISIEDNLPKRICSKCSEQLNVLYEFVNTSLSAEKQLLNWLMPPPSDENTSDQIKQENADGNDGELLSSFQANLIEGDGPQAAMQKFKKRLRRRKVMFERLYKQNENNDDEIDDIYDDNDDEVAPSASKIPKNGDNDDVNGDNETAAKDEDLVEAEEQESNDDNSDDDTKNVPQKKQHKVRITAVKKKKTAPMKVNKSLAAKRTKNTAGGASKKPIKCRKTASNLSSKIQNTDSDENSQHCEAVICDICNLKFKNAVSLALHSKQHNADEKYTCPVCQYQTLSHRMIAKHTKVHDGTTKYKCEVCKKGFCDSTHANEHKYVHTGEKPFQCEICGKSFTFSWVLSTHRNTQHWETLTGTPMVKYDCVECNKHYRSSNGLRIHRLKKHNSGAGANGCDGTPLDTSVLCDECGKRLSSKDKLRVHLRIHSGYKPFSCGSCPKSFTRREMLKEHERVHTGEKPYICHECGKGFTQRTPLRVHLRTHTGERPYVCRHCMKGHMSKQMLDTHVRVCTAIIT